VRERDDEDNGAQIMRTTTMRTARMGWQTGWLQQYEWERGHTGAMTTMGTTGTMAMDKGKDTRGIQVCNICSPSPFPPISPHPFPLLPPPSPSPPSYFSPCLSPAHPPPAIPTSHPPTAIPTSNSSTSPPAHPPPFPAISLLSSPPPPPPSLSPDVI
jgi:hypothetical protein